MSDYLIASTHVDTGTNSLVFDSEGYYVVGDEEWQDITFETTLIYNGGNIGIAPRIYDTNMYLFLTLRNEDADDLGVEEIGFASLNAQVTYDTLNIAETRLPALVVGTSYHFKVQITGTNYRILLDDSVVFNIEYPGMSKGKVGVYGTVGNKCNSIQVKSSFADGWSSNANITSHGAIITRREFTNEDKYIYIYNPSSATVDAYIEQSFDVEANETYSLSYNLLGKVRTYVTELNGTSPKTMTDPEHENSEWGRYVYTPFKVSADCTRVRLRFQVMAGREASINDIQLEKKSFATDYIHNDSLVEQAVREKAIVTYPAKDNIQKDNGSLVMWFNPSVTYDINTEFKPVLVEYGETSPLRIEYEAGGLIFHYGSESISTSMNLTKDTWYNLVATWSRNRIELYVDNVLTALDGEFLGPDDSSIIRIGHSMDETKDTFYGSIDETIILSTVLNENEVEEMQTTLDRVAEKDSMIMRATFNHAIGNFNKSIIEATLAPNYGSPVLVEKESGEAMRKVSFFDFYTGAYRTFNEEVVAYDKRYDYVNISYHEDEIDTTSFKISIQDNEGVTYGEPLSVSGRKINLSLTEEEKEALDGQYLYATYQLEDAYTVDFNIGVPDSFRITLGKHDGQPVKVTYEGNGFTDEKLMTMAELNPLLNPNHEGFLYITKNDEKVTSFRVRTTPEDLPANGVGESLVVVEPLDANGNYISHCKLDVSCELGVVIPAYDEQSVKLRDRAGRFLYRYRSPIQTLENTGALEVEDHISIIDRETGLGVQVSITLSTLQERDHVIKEGDTIFSIADLYGASYLDIAYTSDMQEKLEGKYTGVDQVDIGNIDKVVAKASKYIYEYVGETIKIPINYSAKGVDEAATMIEQDLMIAKLMNTVLDYMNQPASNLPSGLGAILDFNQDNMINMNEITWLHKNRLTTTLGTTYNNLLAWEKAN